MEQQIKHIEIKDLVLWTENPRDPIDIQATDQEIVNRALGEQASKWNLSQLAREMGERYDFSELPTVVYIKNKPVVYDGNRRIILGKIKFKLVKVKGFDPDAIPTFPVKIPCNVCEKRVALEHVLRKHAESGSWRPLERDVFLHKHMHRAKSTFLLLDENTHLISSNKHLNQGFVKEEILREDVLNKMGFSFVGDKLYTRHSNEEAKSILTDLSKKIEDKKITTRKNRGNVRDVLDKKSLEYIDNDAELEPSAANLSFKRPKATNASAQRLTRRRQMNSEMLFGGNLYLKLGVVNELYRDISDLHKFYTDNDDSLSSTFPNLIRMSLRLLCDIAASDVGLTIDTYSKKYFSDGKKKLTSDEKTFLSAQNVTESSIVRLLQIGAHAYSASSNIQQTIAISLILGEMLEISHPKQ